MTTGVSHFPRAAVRLLEGPVKDRQALAGRYLLELNADRLLHNFRMNAGLPSTADPLGGWESPGCGLRGHFVGHYLSASAQMFASTGDERFKARTDALVEQLERCQQALDGEYLSAFPQSEFDTLEAKFGGVWAPYYTLHKILAGLLDAHRDAGSAQALAMASRLGDWVARRLDHLPDETLEPMLRTDGINPSNEFGGIGEALYDLYAITESDAHLRAGQTFDRGWFLGPLMRGSDELAGLHANTHIPQALAAARRFELTGDERYRRVVEHFWERTARSRSYANGGSSGPRPDRRERSEGGEHWPEADRLAGTLTTKINESCVVHNMVRLTDACFRWSRSPRYAEFRERAWWNSVLAVQHPNHVGGYIYSHPLSPGSRKVFGDVDDTFWCCYGTSIEAYARLADGIYFHDADALWVTQFVPSEVAWAEKRVRVTQQTDFPREPRTRLIVHVDGPTAFTMKLRVPAWTTQPTCSVNGEPVGASPGEFVTIARQWRDGDAVDLALPMFLRAESLPGDERTIAFVYGPTVLAARTPHGLELSGPAAEACSHVRLVDPAKLTFRARLAFGNDVPLMPLNEIADEPFGVYFKTH